METIDIINLIGLGIAFILTAISTGILWRIIYKIDEDIFMAVDIILGEKAKLQIDWVKEEEQKVRDEINKGILNWNKYRKERMEKRSNVRRNADIFLTITVIYWFLYVAWVYTGIGLINK